MTQDEALLAPSDAEVVPCMEATLVEAKELLSACLDASIPALLDRDEPPCPACGTAAPLVDGPCGECGLQLG